MCHGYVVVVGGRMHDNFGSGEVAEDGVEVGGSSLPQVAVDATLGANSRSHS